MELQELQENEAEALKAIYMDDFVDTTKSSAWNVSKCLDRGCYGVISAGERHGDSIMGYYQKATYATWCGCGRTCNHIQLVVTSSLASSFVCDNDCYH